MGTTDQVALMFNLTIELAQTTQDMIITLLEGTTILIQADMVLEALTSL